jgi:hypothetical protein
MEREMSLSFTFYILEMYWPDGRFIGYYSNENGRQYTDNPATAKHFYNLENAKKRQVLLKSIGRIANLIIMSAEPVQTTNLKQKI